MKKITMQVLLIVTILSTLTLGCLGLVQTYDTSPERLALDETVTINEVAFKVERFELKDDLTDNHDLRIFYNANDNKFLYILVSAQNQGNEPVEIPSLYDISILYKNRPYRPEVGYHSEEREMYEFNWLEEELIEPGHKNEGWVLFEVPETINSSEIQVIVEFPHVSYTQTAIWSLTS